MIVALLLAAAAQTAGGPVIQVTRPRRTRASVTLLPAQLFEAAAAAQRNRDFATAEEIYRALSSNPHRPIRNEARFRLARMFKG